jgi:hypothetical protein
MLLETLLLSPCFLSGKASIKDSKTTLSVNKRELTEDETLLFFQIDDKSNPYCKLRELFWKTQEGHQLCDLLVFYAKSDSRVFCFVELKDNKKDFPTATKQIISTYHAFKDKLPADFKSKFTTKAFIKCSDGSYPNEYENSLDQLNKERFADYEPNGERIDFLKFLRGETTKFQKKGQKRK